MSNPSLAQYEPANSVPNRISALPDYDDDDEADGDDDDDGPSSSFQERLLSSSDFGSPGWWFRT
jgi:hypothetical protein